MIKMCDLPRYADADMEEIKKMKEAHTVLNQVTYEPKPLYHGYTDKRLRINVTDNTIDMIDIPQEVKEKFTGGKGYCLRYLWDATNPDTKWNSPENAITMVGRTDCRNYAVRRYRKMPGMQHFTDDRYPD